MRFVYNGNRKAVSYSSYMRKQLQHLVTVFLIAVLPVVAATDTLLGHLEPHGSVSDFANVISVDHESRINGVINELNRKTGAEIAVVTIQSLEGSNIDEFTNRLFNQWGVGQKGKDNGLMFLCAMQERKMRIEVGYGLEGAIPDSRAGVIRRNIITPYFKSGNPAEGILAGVEALAFEVAQEYGVELSAARKPMNTPRRPGAGSDWDILWFIIPFIVLAGLAIYGAMKKPVPMGRRNWDGTYGNHSGGSGGYGGGYGGGGFSGGGGFGGGCSGGGGSSGGW